MDVLADRALRALLILLLLSGCASSPEVSGPGALSQSELQGLSGSVTAAATKPTPTMEINLIQVPPAKGEEKTVTIKWQYIGNTLPTSVKCSLDGAKFAYCSSPKVLTVGYGKHNFRIEARRVSKGLYDLETVNFEVVEHSHSGPIDLTTIPSPATGFSDLRIQPTSEVPVKIGSDGAFRIGCSVSHFSHDDPIVYPGGQGKAHLHMFFGNTGARFDSTNESLVSSGNSTCNGGVMNRSGYWAPAIFDKRNGRVIVPSNILVYYKTGFTDVPHTDIINIPPGLRIIAGDMHATAPQAEWPGRFDCFETPEAPHAVRFGQAFPACPVGGRIIWIISFRSCWDGKNLDSADHKSHMAHPDLFTQADGSMKRVCPATHPFKIPDISFNINIPIRDGDDPSQWRLSSDNYSIDQPGGYSAHGDWMNGWTGGFEKEFTANCLHKGLDCHAHLLGDGRMFY